MGSELFLRCTTPSDGSGLALFVEEPAPTSDLPEEKTDLDEPHTEESIEEADHLRRDEPDEPDDSAEAEKRLRSCRNAPERRPRSLRSVGGGGAISSGASPTPRRRATTSPELDAGVGCTQPSASNGVSSIGSDE